MEESFPYHYSILDYIISCFGLLAFVMDIVLDVLTVVTFYQTEDYVFMAVLIFFLLGSSVLIQVFSWLWYSDSLEELQTHVEKYVNRHNLLKAFHVMQFGVFVRYLGLVEISTYRFLQKTDRFPEGVAVNLNHDLCMLRLFETFSESAPQLTLMVSIMAFKQELQLYTGLKTLLAVSGISCSVVVYHRSMREFQPEKTQLSWTSSGLYFFWNLLLILSRVSALALFMSVLPCYIVAHFLSLWMLLVLGVWRQKTDFIDGTCWEWLYRATVGLIWYFSWFNVGSGSTKLKSIVYYTFMGLDTMMLLGFWFWKIEHAGICTLLRPYIVISVLVGLYILGIILRIIYYKNFHPNCDKKKIGELHKPDVIQPAAACIDSDVSAQRISPESPAPTQPLTGAQRRMRIMAANFYY